MNTIQSYNFRARKIEVPPEVHNTRDAKRLKEACQQFESILMAQLWKSMRNNARQLGQLSGSGSENTRPWKQMEDLALEMAAEDLAKSGGAGMWKVLYDQMIASLAAGMKSEPEIDFRG